MDSKYTEKMSEEVVGGRVGGDGTDFVLSYNHLHCHSMIWLVCSSATLIMINLRTK